MSLVTVSKKRARVYRRAFDHDEAQTLHATGEWTVARLADHYGVSPAAVSRVVDPAVRKRMHAHSVEWKRRNGTSPCKGECGRQVWTVQAGRTGYCTSCLADQKAGRHVRETTLFCTRCERWKPDDYFGRDKRHPRRRYRRTWCRACETDNRRENRRRNPLVERAAQVRQRERKERHKMAEFIVFAINGDGESFREIGRTEASGATIAVERVVQQPGTYYAVPASRFQPMRVEPVQAHRVVQETRGA